MGTAHLYEVFVFFKKDGLYIGTSIVSEIDGDVMDGDNRADGYRYSHNLRLNSTQENLDFIKRRSGEEGDILNKIIFE